MANSNGLKIEGGSLLVADDFRLKKTSRFGQQPFARKPKKVVYV